MSHELSLMRPQTQHKYPEHMYLKFLTPLTPLVEKLCIFSMVSSKFISQEILVYYLVNVDHNGVASHLIRSSCEGI